MKFGSHIFNLNRFLWNLVGTIISIATLLVILLGVIGHTVRDYTVELGLLMYIPLLPLGLWAVFWDLFKVGRSLPGFRFGLTFIGLGIIIWGGLSMIGMGGNQSHFDPSQQISVLHWNVHWGGEGKGAWKSIRHDIEQRHPDIAILSEPPVQHQLNQLLKHKGWSIIKHQNTPSNVLAVCSTWPLQLERLVRIREAKGMIVVVTVRGQALRILAIDGRRNMSRRHPVLSRQVLPRWRTPMLKDIVRTIQKSTGQTIDIIAGDFNAISLSRGFDAFAEVGGGYHLASKFAHDWRGTWPSFLPLYDLDHVWIHKRFQGLRTEFLTNLKSDHRGQWVQFQMPI